MALRYTLRQLEYFVAVGDEGSIIKASRKVNVSSPSISAAVAQLEEVFGLQLFVRKHAHGLALTQPGQKLLVQARHILQAANAMNQLADQLSGNIQGALHVGCLLSFAQLLVPGLRREFESAYPLVRVSQTELDQLAIFEQLRAAQIDIALTYDLDIPGDITFIPLVELPPYAMLSEAHPLSHLPCVSPPELENHNMVLLDLPHSAEYFLSLFDASGVRPKVVERTKDMAVLRSLVANNFGYSIANIRPLNDCAPDGRPLRFLPLTGAVRPMQLGLALINETTSTLTVQAFIQHCRECIPESALFKTTD